jgi:hypothetical protein
LLRQREEADPLRLNRLVSGREQRIQRVRDQEDAQQGCAEDNVEDER